MLNTKTLFDMSQVEIDQVDPSTLVDIQSITINDDLPHKGKVLSYLEQIRNPYCFKSGNVAVRVRFMDDDSSLSDSLARYFARLKQN